MLKKRGDTRECIFTFDDDKKINVKSKDLLSCCNVFKDSYYSFIPVGKIISIVAKSENNGKIIFNKIYIKSDFGNLQKVDDFMRSYIIHEKEKLKTGADKGQK